MKSSLMAVLAAGTCLLFAAGCSSSPQISPAPAETKPAAAAQKAPAPPISAESERLYTQGLAEYEQLRYDAAIAAYDQALAADRSNYKALSGKGVAMAMRGNDTGNKDDVTSGISLIQQALSIYPDYTAGFYDLALACKTNGQGDVAIQYFKKVLAAEPDNTWSYYGIATIYGDRGQAKEAVAYLKKAAALDRENVVKAAQTQSHFDRIRQDPEFQALVQP